MPAEADIGVPLTDSDDIQPRSPRRRAFAMAVLAVATGAIGISMTVAGGFWGSGDSSNPLDPTHFGAGTADSPYCNRDGGFSLWRPVC